MRLIETRNLDQLTFKLWTNEVSEHYVEIYIGGDFWDHREFASLKDAQAFMSDPLADDRAQEKMRSARLEREAEASIPYYARDYTKVSKGRKIGPKAGAA